MLSALIFDLDGVITLTSAEYHYLSWQRLAEEEGLPFSRDDYERLRGVNRMESLDRFLNGASVTDTQRRDYLDRKQRYYLDLLDAMTPADRLPGVAELLTECQRDGIRAGVASASRNVTAVLDKLALHAYFDVIGDPSCVHQAKPAPDMFLWVAGALRAPVEQTVILEDSAEGVEIARSAGFYTVGVGDRSVLGGKAHLTVRDLARVRLDILRELVNPSQRPRRRHVV